MSYFMTDPDNVSDELADKPKIKRRGQFVRYCDRVVQELVHLGMPLRAAEVALIDMRHTAFVAYNDKEVPLTAAERIFNKAKDIYTDKDKDGNRTWHYAG
jgi:hypothetical protein